MAVGFLQGILQIVTNKKTKLYGFIVLTVSLMGFHFILVPTGLIYHIPHLTGVIFPLLFLLGPILYKAVNKDVSSKIHFFLFFLVLIIFVPFYLSEPEVKISFMLNYNSGYNSLKGKFFFWMGMGHIIFYLILSIRVLIGKERRSLVVYTLLLVIILLEAGVNLLSYRIEINSELMDMLDNIFIILLLNSIGFRSYFSEKKSIKIAYRGREIPDREWQEIDEALKVLINNSFYLDPEMSLEAVSTKTGFNRNQISRYINQYLGQNFKEWLNGLRAEHLKKELINQPDKNILDLAYSSGFKSKTTYNNFFKKRYDLTPSEFRKKFQNM